MFTAVDLLIFGLLFEGKPFNVIENMVAVKNETSGEYDIERISGHRRLESYANSFQLVNYSNSFAVLSETIAVKTESLSDLLNEYDIRLIGDIHGTFVVAFTGNRMQMSDVIETMQGDTRFSDVEPMLARWMSKRSDCECTERTAMCTSNGIDVSERCGCANHGGSVELFCYVKQFCTQAYISGWKDNIYWTQCNYNYYPDDQYFTQQWHLMNTGQTGNPGIDTFALEAWNQGYFGSNVTVAVVDDGVETTHPDLKSNINIDLSYDWNDNTPLDANPMSHNSHGTSVAGLIGARDNHIGIIGMSPRISLVPYRLIAGPITPYQEYSAFVRDSDKIDIKTNSWGPPDNQVFAMPAMSLDGLKLACHTGRHRLGTVFIFAAGNGGALDDVNLDPYASSQYTIAVTGVGADGKVPHYAEHGSCLIVSSLSSGYSDYYLATTDLSGSGGYVNGNYISGFGYTSAAAPVVAGVVALMLQANQNLTWRDVQEILLYTAYKNDRDDPGWLVNGAGMNYHHFYGAGIVNASSAVQVASDWVNLGSRIELSNMHGIYQPLPVSYSFNVSSMTRIEHVILELDFNTSAWSSVRVNLTSPFGATSELIGLNSVNSAHDGLWNMSSVVNWGENAYGSWTFTMQGDGFVRRINHIVYGTVPLPPPPAPCSDSSNNCATTVNLCGSLYFPGNVLDGFCDHACGFCDMPDSANLDSDFSLFEHHFDCSNLQIRYLTYRDIEKLLAYTVGNCSLLSCLGSTSVVHVASILATKAAKYVR